jgi:serine phosphatase RsbU (regulator of sigma subunit)
VMGTGATARDTGRAVAAAWGELAAAEPSLTGIAVRLHTLIARSAHPERFVTALLVTFGCTADRAELVSCGHPPPLLLRGSSASYVQTFPAPPLGLMDLTDGWCSAVSIKFTAGDRMLLYTDGASEARDASRAEFPLTQRSLAAHQSGSAPDEEMLDGLLGGLRKHVGGQPADDILLVLASR